MTRWSPDTCGCVVDYDDNLKVTAVVTKCVKHANTADDATHFEAVLAHNRKKNAVHNAVSDHLAAIGAKSEALVVAYDENDDLHVFGSGLLQSDQDEVTRKVKARLGKSALRFPG
jgi:hypothetical protein